MAGNPPRQDPGPPYTWLRSLKAACFGRASCVRFLPPFTNLARTGSQERSPTPPLRARLGWREPVRAVNTSCPATTARALHAGHPVLWHAGARKGGNQLSGAGGRGVGNRLGLLLQRRGDRAHGECGGHAVPSHLALRLPIPQPQPSSWPRIGQALGSEQPVGSQWAGCALPKPVALPLACADRDAAGR